MANLFLFGFLLFAFFYDNVIAIRCIYFNLSHLSLKPEWFVVFTVAVFIYDLFMFIVLITCHLFWKTTQNNITHLKAVSGPSTEICRRSLPRYPDLVNRVYECIYRLVFVRFLSTDILKHFIYQNQPLS